MVCHRSKLVGSFLILFKTYNTVYVVGEMNKSGAAQSCSIREDMFKIKVNSG